MFDAAGRAQALEQAELHRDIALIVLDLALPDGNGLDLLMELRSRLPSADVVVLSASSEPGMVAKVLRLGAKGFGNTSCVVEAGGKNMKSCGSAARQNCCLMDAAEATKIPGDGLI